jgi:hypothetical protein
MQELLKEWVQVVHSSQGALFLHQVDMRVISIDQHSLVHTQYR